MKLDARVGGADAATDGEVAGLVQGPRRQRSHQRPRRPARPLGGGGDPRSEAERHRRTVCGEGSRHRLDGRRGEGPGPRERAVAGVPHLRAGRLRRGAAHLVAVTLEHLFRREAGRMVATLTRVLGVANLALAEDVVQDALCRALETWKIRGVPDDPAAWLMATAKNRALDVLRRERTARSFEPEVARHIESAEAIRARIEELSAGAPIASDQLRMMFSCCNPRLTEESQIALVLHILCGFSVSEIASAFLSRDETVKKRVTGAKGA